MAITIKRSTLTLKKTEEASAATAPHLTSGPVLSAGESAPAWTGYAIAGLICMLFLVGLIVLQYAEYAHYQDAFPIRVPQAAVTAPKPAEKAGPATSKPAEEAEPAAAKPAEKAEPVASKPAETAEPAAAKPAVEEPAAKEAAPATVPAPVEKPQV